MFPDEKEQNQGEQRANEGTSVAAGKGEQQAQQPAKPKRPRGLAAADPETRRLVARKGGEAVSRNKKHMADIGRKGGEAVSQDRRHMASIGRKGGEAVSQNREHMAEIGRKGGESRGLRHHESDQSQSLQSDQQGDAQREFMGQPNDKPDDSKDNQ